MVHGNRVSIGCYAMTDAKIEEIYSLVDAVSIVVPTSQHHAVARGFIRRGVDVMIEKPITATLPEASELIRMAKQRDCILQSRLGVLLQERRTVLARIEGEYRIRLGGLHLGELRRPIDLGRPGGHVLSARGQGQRGPDHRRAGR